MNGTAVLTHVFERPLRAFRQDPQIWVITVVGVIIAYLSLSPTLCSSTAAFLSKPLGVPGNFTLAHYIQPTRTRSRTSYFSIRLSSPPVRPFWQRSWRLLWLGLRSGPMRPSENFRADGHSPENFPPVMLAVAWTILLSPRTGLINRL